MLLEDRSRGIGLADRDLEAAWRYLSRKLSSQDVDVYDECDIVVDCLVLLSVVLWLWW